MNKHDFALLKIGELAGLAGVSVKALRVYEKKQVIIPVEIDEESGYRYYSADQVEQIESLLELQDMGFSLDEIRDILSGELSKEDLLSVFEQKEKALRETIWKAEAKIEEIKAIKAGMGDGSDTDKIREMTDAERAWLLAKLVRVNDSNVRQAISEAIWL